MKFTRTPVSLRARHFQAGFTLAEVLAALVFLALVIPVAVQGIQVASRAGQFGARKAAAVRIADRVLNELDVTGQLTLGSQSGVVREGAIEYPWRLDSQSWMEGDLDLAVVRVQFDVQGRAYEARLATLVDPDAVHTGFTTR